MNNGGDRTCKTGMTSKELGRETLARWQQEDFHQWKKQPCSVQVSKAVHQHMHKKRYWGRRNILILFSLVFGPGKNESRSPILNSDYANISNCMILSYNLTRGII